MADYQICTICVLDTSDPDIEFDEQGVCNYCRKHAATPPPFDGNVERRADALAEVVEQIKKSGRGKPYDCILGVSGGVDSTYAALRAHELGLRPLAVHLDNGWNSELAVDNIESTLKELGIDLYTHVINWPEFRDLQLSFFKASVIDIEMLTDHAIFALLYKQAARFNLKYIISGSNTATEGYMPPSWIYRKWDLRNIKAIHSRYGSVPMKTFPALGLARRFYYRVVKGFKLVPLLEYGDYVKEDAMQVLQQRLSWRDYGGKHFESVFTRFYQGYILPTKFNVDKRRPHLSNLVRNKQLTREEAIAKLNEDSYPLAMQANDKEFVLKKLGFSSEEFERYISEPPKSHTDYKNSMGIYNLAKQLLGRGA